MVLSQSRVQTDAGIAVLKMALDTGKDNADQMTDMMKNIVPDPYRGQNLDVRV